VARFVIICPATVRLVPAAAVAIYPYDEDEANE